MYASLQSELSCYTSIVHVLDKLEDDNELSGITRLFGNLLHAEIHYAVTGTLTRAAKAEQDRR
mgnify:CR=1 FL=1